MRLLNAATLDFKFFNDDELPPYSILSHTWGSEEVCYQELEYVQKRLSLTRELHENAVYVAALEAAAALEGLDSAEFIRQRAGYRKIEQTARLARESGLDWFWVDTCCIDKSSSAELQEAINSMYRWYKISTRCVVVLEDVELHQNSMEQPTSVLTKDELTVILCKSRWITRGWTLQELLAPSTITFYDAHWKEITTKATSITILSDVTRIPEYVLVTGDLSRNSIAQKMSWAAKRTTSRVEDVAYSLLGLFDIHMPMLYGERQNAFLRLQEEIIRKSPDDSIFAWTAENGSCSTYRGLFARSPSEFEHSHLVLQGNGTFASSNMGLRVEMDIFHVVSHPEDDNLFLGRLSALWSKDTSWNSGRKQIAIVLRMTEPQKFARVFCNKVEDWTERHTQRCTKEVIYVERVPQIWRRLRSRAIRSLHIRSSWHKTSVTYSINSMRSSGNIIRTQPPVITMSRDVPRFGLDLQFPELESCLVTCISLEQHKDIHEPWQALEVQQTRFIWIVYNTTTARTWCKSLVWMNRRDMLNPVESWSIALRNECTSQSGAGTTAAYSRHMSDGHVNLGIELCEDELCLIVRFDGLLI
jgi:hypothetical protein